MNNLKKIRTAKHMTQSQVARELNISRQAYYNYETGKREADYETLLKLGELFGCSVEDIISQKENATDNDDGRKKLFISYDHISSDFTEALLKELDRLSDDDLNQVYSFAKFLALRSEKESENKK